MYFQRIGASGYALGKIKTVAPPVSPGLWLRYAVVHRRHARGDRQAHPRRGAGRPRLDRLGADHRQARCDFDAGQRRDVHLEPRACAVDLRLSHGGGGRHRVLFHSRRLGADPVARQPPSDQEMGGRRRARRGRLLSAAVGRGGRHPALLHHDRDRAGRRHAGPAGDHLPHAHGRRLRRAAAGAGIGRASEFPDVVRGDARADRGLSIRPAVARQGRHIARRARGAVGRARDRRAYPGLAGRRPRHHALCRLSLPPRRRLMA